MGQESSSHKYEVDNIKKSILKKLSDPEVKKGIGSALIYLGIVLGVMGITFTAVAYGSPWESAHSFPAAGPCLIVVTIIFFGTGATLIRHSCVGCFQTRDGEADTGTENDTLLIFCCVYQQTLPLYKKRKTDERTIDRNPENILVCDNFSSANNSSNRTDSVINISGSLVSFSSLRNFKVYPIDIGASNESSEV